MARVLFKSRKKILKNEDFTEDFWHERFRENNFQLLCESQDLNSLMII